MKFYGVLHPNNGLMGNNSWLFPNKEKPKKLTPDAFPVCLILTKKYAHVRKSELGSKLLRMGDKSKIKVVPVMVDITF